MEEKLEEIWETWKPYHESTNGRSRSFVVSGTEAAELGIDTHCLHLCESNEGEIYFMD